MSLRLILMRHAKSDWNAPAGSDFDRPLNRRGCRDAPAIGRWLAGHGHIPRLVLCSAARRSRDTCALVLEAMQAAPELRHCERLYLASAEAMFRTLAQLGCRSPVMMVAHNPGTAILARALAERTPPHPRFDDFPTAATAVLEFALPGWAELAAGSGQVIDFAIPRELHAGRSG